MAAAEKPVAAARANPPAAAAAAALPGGAEAELLDGRKVVVQNKAAGKTPRTECRVVRAASKIRACAKSGFAIVSPDSTPLPDGEYTLKNGDVLTVTGGELIGAVCKSTEAYCP